MIKKICTEYETEGLGDYIRTDCIPEKYKKTHGIFLYSGFFCPTIHNGHLAVIEEMNKKRDLWNWIIVAVNGDNSTKRKYGFSIPAIQRAKLMSSINGVDYVIIVDQDNMSDTIRKLKCSYFFNGGDRHSSNVNQAEIDACNAVNCRIIYGTGGFDKKASNSQYIKMIRGIQ